ncbi:MAG: T9SS type A sorting domain-containing protein, partial [Crocinitomicaceae bacterium]|nr:T9SS type A sorting domain-containing protein [Crocinitomicaceae bacterium]
PALKESYDAYMLLQNSQVNSPLSEAKSDQSYVIPVVFHILHEYGSENISDAQVYDALEIFNREFNAADPDSVDLVAEFDTLNGNAKITFKLASLDPFGNCTNGIEHIYTHETRVGDSYSKMNQWNRSKYLNIWVVDVVGVPGAAAYATLPAGTDGSGFWRDGILSAHNYVGSIGTSSTFNESVLTHEIGHWLSLAHTFGNSDLINDGPTICNDDGILDTPATKGHLHCNFTYPSEWISCDTTNAVVEDIQNYMDYSYCDRHFTPGQCTFMHNALQGVAGQRNNIWLDSTLIATGVKDLLVPQAPNDQLTVPLCVPIADFYSSDKTVCMGAFASFSDVSWNAVVDSRAWTFQDGNPATSTSANVNVSFDSPGWKLVTLTVTNTAGSDTKQEKYIYVAPDWPENYGPTSFDMESKTTYATGTDHFVIQNQEDNYGKFGVVSNYGYNGSKAFKLQTYKDVSNADAYTADYFYNYRLGLSVDNLITPSMDLRNTSGITVTFKYAYATNATLAADIIETLKVYSTRNCGETWTPKILSIEGNTVGTTITGDDIVTAGYASNADFNPTNNTMWKEASFTYSATSQDRLTRFKFEFEASDLASNIFIDEINITGILGIHSEEIADLELMIYPNPTNGEAINVSYFAQNDATEFILRDVQGKIIAQQIIETTNSQVTQSLDNTEDLPSACYFLEIKTGDFSTTKKVVVL